MILNPSLIIKQIKYTYYMYIKTNNMYKIIHKVVLDILFKYYGKEKTCFKCLRRISREKIC